MSTHAAIVQKIDDTLFRGIYCHFDGYGLIDTLSKHYTSEESVSKLISLGDISYLKPSIDDTCAYHRDRFEPWSRTHFITDTIENVLSKIDHSNHIYVYDNEWHYINANLHSINEVLSMIEDGRYSNGKRLGC